jgi:hypothetical protein
VLAQADRIENSLDHLPLHRQESIFARYAFIAMCKRNAVEPFAWFRDVLTHFTQHSIHRIEELLPQNWRTLAAAAQA